MNAILALLLLLQATTAARPGVVTGQLQTREGAPAAAVRISALPAPPVSILPSDGQNYFATTTPASTALTDAQGRYRLTNLAPGRYLIVASAFGYPTFHPGTTSADRATAVAVAADSPADGVDFTVVMPPGGRVSGRVSTPPTTSGQEKAILSGLALGELLETPVGSDGSFSFGHLPKGVYLLSLFPTPPGMPSHVFQVGETDTRLDLVRPTLRRVSGRLVAQTGSLPRVLLGFSTERSYVTADVRADGTFSAQLQPARHTIELGGLTAGYSLASARLDAQDVSKGLEVGAGDIAGLVITVAPPAHR
ncbi:MAG TPA: carboxypeptidase-like regulatory domain-containing protein [Vicinamibacterales bacterium]|nr:carboxypeptidase-like regulatory domain-containing protein [Vicinamibacterales bacterium]